MESPFEIHIIGLTEISKHALNFTKNLGILDDYWACDVILGLKPDMIGVSVKGPNCCVDFKN